MKLQLLDFLVILAYLLTIMGIGLYLRKRAARSKNDYMLGGNSIPWWMLGISNASGMFDISGTIWLVTIGFVYGLKSVWIPWLWPVFNQIFLMVYLSLWLRRSNVSTGAEWINTRFGKGADATLSHTIVVVFALLSCLGFMAYGFVGLGKFIEIFIPWSMVSPYIPFAVSPAYVPHFYGIIFSLIATLYAVTGGMSSIVWADVVQYAIMTVASFVVAGLAMYHLSSSTLVVPDGWYSPFFGWELNMDWSKYISEVNDKITSDGFSPFGFFFSIMLFKGVLSSVAGPAPNYDMQKILSTRSPKEAALMSAFVNVVLMPARYFMIIGFVVLAVLFFKQLDLSSAKGIDFEKILPSAIHQFAPAGLMGLLLAGLMAAFMGTFAGTLNAAQAYIVNDIYLKRVNPSASAQSITRVNYLVGIVVVIISIIFGVLAQDVNTILQWIVSALFGGYVAANILKWHWWRFNGQGFFWGMVAGIVPALIFPYLLPKAQPLYYFPAILGLSLVGSIVGTLLTKPTDTETLKSFYKNIQPWGFWKPIHDLVVQDDPAFKTSANLKRDMFNVVVGVIAQTALVILPMYIVLMQWMPTLITTVILAITMLILWKTWYIPMDKAEKENEKKKLVNY
jgi:solute:Na+ symporter, SSS family